jgi:aminoglycoside phosphotransferase (APT) family kinase protein
MSTGQPRTFDAERRRALEAWLKAALGAERVVLGPMQRLPGGAIQENWRLAVSVEGGLHGGRHDWVLRTDAAARLSLGLDRAAEYAVLAVAHSAGVTVAAPVARCPDPGVIGAPFLVQGFVPGIAQARRVVRDPQLPVFGEALAERLGAELAAIHRILPPRQDLSFLPIPLHSPARGEVARLRLALDGAGEARPALEYVLSWLHYNAPPTRHITLVHGDFRTGNYLVHEGRLTAILDWEFAHWGDPHEDIGWFLARCWRFGNDELEAGGIGSRAAFYRGYNSAAGNPLDPAVIPYWEIMAAAKWATVAVLQGDRFRKGGEDSIELALTGLMPPEMEFDALQQIRAIRAAGGPGWQ